MSIETIPGTGQKYYLISYDAKGIERTGDPDGLMSEVIAAAIDSQLVTDIFIFDDPTLFGDPAVVDNQFEANGVFPVIPNATGSSGELPWGWFGF